MRKGQLLFVLVLAAALGVTACAAAGGPSTTIDVTFTDFTFEPAEFTIPAEQTITINTKNEGAVLHEFVIMKLGMTAGDTFGDEDEANIYWEVETEPGQSSTATFTAPAEAGVYELLCGTEGHLQAGMVGKLTVTN